MDTSLWLILVNHPTTWWPCSGEFWWFLVELLVHRTVSRFLHRCHRSPEVPDLWRISWSISTSTCGRVRCLSEDFAAERHMILVMFHVPNDWVSYSVYIYHPDISSWYFILIFHPDFIAFASTWILFKIIHIWLITSNIWLFIIFILIFILIQNYQWRICGSAITVPPFARPRHPDGRVTVPSAMFGFFFFWRICGENLEDLNTKFLRSRIPRLEYCNLNNLNNSQKRSMNIVNSNWTRSRHLRHMGW